MPTYKPDPAAVEAARKIHKRRTQFAGNLAAEAAIIDSATHVGELREALRDVLTTLECFREEMDCYPTATDFSAVTRAESLLANMNVSDTMLDSRRLRHGHD